MRKIFAFLFLISLVPAMLAGGRNESVIAEGWQFTKGASDANTKWQNVSVPHDWAIYGPFDRSNDLQVVAVEQNGETEKTVKTGRTGGLPYIGKGEYRTTFIVPEIAGKSVSLVFDGAMSNAHVEVNGKEVGHWAFGYNSFHFCIDDAVKAGENTLRVKLENYPEINRRITDEEYDEVVDYAIDLGVENGFIQDEEAACESFIPKFNLKGV